MHMANVIEIAQKLIACPSVTPHDAGAQEYLGGYLESLGFDVHHLPFGEGAERVPNIFARIGEGNPHICYAGHTDVVPPGPEDQWNYGPFNPVIEDGVLYGRGASDMKGSVAAFAAAAAHFLGQNAGFNGSISMLITGDEEGVAEYGTVKVLQWMEENGHIPDMCLVGEPTNPEYLGQEIKIGRRGSFTGHLKVQGKQGHVAYPHKADNPIPRMAAMLNALALYRFDEGSDFFAPTNLEITTVDTGNTADNVIPKSVSATFNIRFNDHWSEEKINAKIRALLDGVSTDYTLSTRCSGESFITEPGPWSEIVSQAVKDITGHMPVLTTSGGTSDARFVRKYCPVLECGPVNATIHQIDENAGVQVLEDLTRIYVRVLELSLKA